MNGNMHDVQARMQQLEDVCGQLHRRNQTLVEGLAFQYQVRSSGAHGRVARIDRCSATWN